MRDDYEAGYLSGVRSALQQQIRNAIKELGYEGMTLESALIELEQCRAALRDVCADFGDNDWSDNLSLADVVQKHLANHLHAAEVERG